MNDTERLDLIIKNKLDIDAPEPPDSTTWVIYGPKAALGGGLACDKDLRKAIDLAAEKL